MAERRSANSTKAKGARPRVRLAQPDAPAAALSERQAMVLRALVAAYVGRAEAVGSTALSHLLPTPLSPASIRNTLAELHALGLIDKAHASAGRVPTAAGLRVFVDELLELGDLGPHHQRLLDREFDQVDAAATPRQASHLLSEHTGQLGFVLAPRVEHLRLRSIHLVPVATGRLLAILVAQNGGVVERVVDGVPPMSPREIERVQAYLAERTSGRTLRGLRQLLEREQAALRGEADELLRQALLLGLEACRSRAGPAEEDLVIATRLALLDQPEFADPERIRALFAAIETNEQLLDFVTRLASESAGVGGVEGEAAVSMSLGAELGEPSLRDCALVVVPYGQVGEEGAGARADAGDGALGALGVIGPQRMDYGRVIPLVQYCSDLVTRKLLA